MISDKLDAEEMAVFFDRRAGSYDEHMRCSVTEFDAFYTNVAGSIERTKDPVTILDLGCGTGLELDHIFARAPQCRVTAVDLSPAMLSELSEKYTQRSDQLTIVCSSYLELTIEPERWDHIISVMTMHHLTCEEKLRLYGSIHQGLKPGGSYIEGDYVVSPDEEEEHLERYGQLRNVCPAVAGGAYHLDIPLSVETQRGLFSMAGFSGTHVVWQAGTAAVFVARR